MNAGRGDLPRLAADLASGHLTGAPPSNYVLLLQEAVSGVGVDADELAKARSLHAFVVPVYELLPARTVVPVPDCVSVPAPLIAPATVTVPVLLITSAVWFFPSLEGWRCACCFARRRGGCRG